MLTLYNQDCAPIGPTATSVASKLAGFAGRDRMIAANRLIDWKYAKDRAVLGAQFQAYYRCDPSRRTAMRCHSASHAHDRALKVSTRMRDWVL